MGRVFSVSGITVIAAGHTAGFVVFVCRSKSGVVFGADFGYIPSPGHSTKFSEIRWNSVTSILQTREFHILRQTVEHVWIQ
jgi:hypothetical protein